MKHYHGTWTYQGKTYATLRAALRAVWLRKERGYAG